MTASASLAAADDPVGTCPLFGRCGGCALLDRPADVYAAQKQASVVAAFAAVGLAPDVAPLRRTPFASRRRATLSVQQERVGYQAARSHEVIDVADCPALDPALNKALPAVRRIARSAGNGARVVATLVANGIDVAVTRPAGRGKKQARTPLPDDPAIVRLTVDGDIALALETPVVRFDGVAVPFPPGGFLQASRAGEAALVELVTAAVAGDDVLDAFAGLGTFALPLSRTAKVTAVDVEGPALEALAAAAARTTGRRPIRTLRRNLFRDPLSVKELAGFDTVVFDPPRAGAEALARSLAGSAVPRLVGVSCDPATLARDAKILGEGGYEITQVVPVDQFVGTRHIEAVATFGRAR